MNKIALFKKTQLLPGFILLSLLILSANSARLAYADPPPPQPGHWKNARWNIGKDTNFCVDSGRYNQIVFYSASKDFSGPGTYALNLDTGQRTLLSTHRPDICAPNGFYYEKDSSGFGGYRFSSLTPGDQKLEYLPQNFATDGSQTAYWLLGSSDYIVPRKSKLLFSPDAGLTWQERGQQLEGRIMGITVAATDGRLVYATTQAETVEADGKRILNIWLSKDAGQTWEKRSETKQLNQEGRGGVAIYPINFASYLTQNNILLLRHDKGGFGSTYSPGYLISFDGGQTYEPIAETATRTGLGMDYNGSKLLRMITLDNGDRSMQSYHLPTKTWGFLMIPGGAEDNQLGSFTVPLVNPETIFLTRQKGSIWYSSDSGTTWRSVVDGPKEWSDLGSLSSANSSVPGKFKFAPYMPGKLVALAADGTLYTFDFSANDKQITKPNQPNQLTADNLYFSQTGHNLNGLFRQYWENNGGLAQFGYPKTDPIPEYNPADGKIYTVQYFERNRFEYHPEYVGTKYEVLLGLLGKQLTEQKRAEGHAAFKPAGDQKYPGGTYFTETGHNLRSSFKTYWEQNGGLALYGYPISEEFEEVNPDDGKTYTVQYFERNRFEYHPENKGSKYEVLLGLLGNSLLRDKGWQN